MLLPTALRICDLIFTMATTPTGSTPNNAPPPQQPQWTRTRAFAIALTLRLLLCARWIPPDWQSFLHPQNRALRSLLVSPTWTLEHVRQVSCTLHWGDNDIPSSQVDPFLGADLPPLWLLFWECFLNLPHSDLVVALLLTAVDYLVASLWYRIGQRRTTSTEEQECVTNRMPELIRPPANLLSLLPDERQLPSLLALLYFANPITILASAVYGGLANTKLALLLMAVVVSQNDDKSMWRTSVALGAVLYLDLSYGVFAVALAIPWWDATLFVFAALQLASQSLAPSFSTTTMLSLLLPGGDLASNNIPPSLSILWYTHMEFFTRFAPLLRLLLGGLPYLVVIPLAIRLHRYPLVLVRQKKCDA